MKWHDDHDKLGRPGFRRNEFETTIGRNSAGTVFTILALPAATVIFPGF